VTVCPPFQRSGTDGGLAQFECISEGIRFRPLDLKDREGTIYFRYLAGGPLAVDPPEGLRAELIDRGVEERGVGTMAFRVRQRHGEDLRGVAAEEVPLWFVQKVFHTMEKASWHTFQILTKRAERLAEPAPEVNWPSNVWMGVSIETAKYLWRAEHLREVPTSVRLLSLEPLLGPLGALDLSGIHWVIVGGERTWCSTHRGRLGQGDPQAVPPARCALLLQAVR
jgi:hypothetical protein